MKSAGPARYQPSPTCNPCSPTAAGGASEQGRAPARAPARQVAVEQDENPEQERRGHDDAEEQSETERLPAERLVDPLAPLPGHVLERREHDGSEDHTECAEHEQAADEPSAHETPGGSAVEDDGQRLLHRAHHPGRAPEREAEREETGQAPGRGDRGDQRVEPGRTLGREIELVGDRRHEILAVDAARRQHLGQDRRDEGREGHEGEERPVGDRRRELRAAEAAVAGEHVTSEIDEAADDGPGSGTLRP